MNPPKSSSNILIVAAEASSALYAERLLEHWKQQGKDVSAFGIGSRAMETLGFDILGRSEELAVVGIQEVVSHWGQIKETFHKLVQVAEERKPDFVLLLDYPEFNMRLAKKMKALGVPVIYYISPQIWAWRTGRVKKLKPLVDLMLVLFPFEEKFYDEHNIPCEFIGHPLLDELSPDFFNKESLLQAREKYGLVRNKKVLALMPGSRNSEIKHHLDVQLKTAEKIYFENPNVQIVINVAPTFSKQEFQSFLPPLNFPLQLIQGEPFSMISLADVVLTASGTATLMVGLMEKPMVIMYRMNSLTAFLAKRFVKYTNFFGMINLILNEKVVPEFFQEQASIENLSHELNRFLNDDDLYDKTRNKLKTAKNKLGKSGATLRVAERLEEFFEK